MPIRFNKELPGWEVYDLTEDEEEALLDYAKEMIVDGLGAELAANIMRAVTQKSMLSEIPQEDMGHA